MLEGKISQFIFAYRLPLFTICGGIVLVVAGIFLQKHYSSTSSGVEILSATDSATPNNILTIEVSGAVNSPGVFDMPPGSRIDDALKQAGGLTDDAHADWVERFINKAAKLVDGQKLYIPTIDEQTDVLSATNNGEGVVDQNISTLSQTNTININTASQSDLEDLWGIGPVTAQKIIEQRPYSSVEELLSKKIIKQNVYDRIKNQISIF